jgi:hypothetical protein
LQGRAARAITTTTPRRCSATPAESSLFIKDGAGLQTGPVAGESQRRTLPSLAGSRSGVSTLAQPSGFLLVVVQRVRLMWELADLDPQRLLGFAWDTLCVLHERPGGGTVRGEAVRSSAACSRCSPLREQPLRFANSTRAKPTCPHVEPSLRTRARGRDRMPASCVGVEHRPGHCVAG